MNRYFRPGIMSICLLLIIGCNNYGKKAKHLSIHNDLSIDSLEIYCWCFRHPDKEVSLTKKTATSFPFCETPVRIHPKDIISSKNHYITFKKAEVVNRLAKVFLEGRNPVVDTVDGVDARFIILLKRKLSSDTLVYINDSTFCYNDIVLFHYNFNVMDSFKRLLKLKTIDCLDR